MCVENSLRLEGRSSCFTPSVHVLGLIFTYHTVYIEEVMSSKKKPFLTPV